MAAEMSHTAMTAFLKIDRCIGCARELPWEWVPPVTIAGKPFAGTGMWRSALVGGRCTACMEADRRQRLQEQRRLSLRDAFISAVGGIKPYREFTFERFQVTDGNRLAVDQAKRFDVGSENLYLWGPCGVGKTHLAVAILREHSAKGATIEFTTPARLVRRMRMKSPEEEQQALDYYVGVNLLVLDDLGMGGETAFARQVLLEILDRRNYRDRGGLIVTSPYPLNLLATRLNDTALSSRLSGMCRVIGIRGNDGRRAKNQGNV
jgi:DNA replication protein DnaC